MDPWWTSNHKNFNYSRFTIRLNLTCSDQTFSQPFAQPDARSKELGLKLRDVKDTICPFKVKSSLLLDFLDFSVLASSLNWSLSNS